MKKRFFQVCSFFLSIAILISMLPMSVFAEELQEAVANAQAATESTETEEVSENSETYVVDELVEKRTEFSKEFLLSNGLHMAAVYADAVHYETEDGWEEIDNTLKTNADGTLSNTAGVWDVSFPQQLTEENSITIEKDGYTLSFSMAGELTASGAALMTAGLDEEVVPFSVTEVQASNAQVQEIDTTSMEETMEYPEAVPDKVQSQVSYADVYENTDVVYDLNSNQVKESVILESYNEALQGYRYTLDVGTMNPVLEEDGQITFYDADGENVVLVMPAPFLVDDAGVYNNEIQVQLTGSGSSYTMLYLLPQQWLAAEERAWPVVLDPIVQVDMDINNIRDKTVYENDGKDGGAYQNNAILDTGYYSGTGILRSYLKYNDLPTITSSDVIVGAEIQLRKVQNSPASGVIEVHKVNDDNWDSTSINWGNKPAYDPKVEDYVVVQAEGEYRWVVTDIVRDWYASGNTGMMFKATDEVEKAKDSNSFKQFYSSDYTEDDGYQPYLLIEFRNNNGIESNWNYSSSSAGRAGTGHINNFTGNLTWIRDDIGFSGNRMPVTISHVYNLNDVFAASELDDGNNSNDSGGNSFGLGVGWRTNYNQLVYRWELDDQAQAYYVWEDDDGTDHYFKPTADGYQDEYNEDRTLTVNSSGSSKYIITEKYGSTRHFDDLGRLIMVQNNQATKSSIEIEYVSESKRISKITDGAGREYVFTYNSSNMLTEINYQNGVSKVTFGYENDMLTSVTDNDNNTSTYTYTGKLLKKAINIDGYQLWYKYTDVPENELWRPYRVQSVCAYDDTVQGGNMTFAYTHNQTTITDHNAKKQILQFNDFGNLICIQDGEGRAQFSEYAINTDEQKNTNTDTAARVNQLRVSSDLQYTATNLLQDGNMRMGDMELWSDWDAEFRSNMTLTTDVAYADASSVLVESGSGEGYGGVYLFEPVLVEPKETYTFSCFVKPKSASVYLMATDGAEEFKSDVEPISEAWRRLQISYTNTSEARKRVTFHVLTEDTGDFYLDCAQLEKAAIASRYNLINNSDFRTGDADNWMEINCEDGDGVVILDEGTTVAAPQLDNNVFKITGNPTRYKSLWQKVLVIGRAGDSLLVSGWAKGNAAPARTDVVQKRIFAIQCVIKYTDGTTETFTADFNPDSDEWQYAATGMIAKKDYRLVTVKLIYNFNVNTVYFDGVQLNLDEFGNCYAYNEEGKVVSVVNAQGEKTTYEYTNNDLTKEILPSGAEMTYTYDDYHNVETATTQEGLIYTFDYDDWGNNTSVSISATEDGQEITMSNTATYKDEGNLLSSTTDALGNKTTYDYDSNTGVLKSAKLPEDEDDSGAVTTYEYDELFRKKCVSLVNGTSEENIMSVSYTYSNDELQQIETETTKYTFENGKFGLRQSVSAGNRALATYHYEDEVANGETADKNFDLDRLVYGNGDFEKYKRDDMGRETLITYEDGDTVEKSYDSSGSLATVYDSESDITTAYCYDLTDRLLKYLETGTEHNVSLLYTYGDNNMLSRVREDINGTIRTRKYTYDNDDRLTIFQNESGYRYYTYDAFNRMSETVTKNLDYTMLETEYTFVNPTETTTSNQLSSIRQVSTGHDVAYNYTYDKNGNILSVTEVRNHEDAEDKDKVTSYTYDSANQLVREDNEKEGKTWKWTYDAGGNITCRREYAYTDAQSLESAQILNETVYEYGKDGWGDLLTRKIQTISNGVVIASVADENAGIQIETDAIGNTTDDGTWTYTWEHGRELASMSDKSTAAKWDFTYNANGMRTKRVSTDKEYTYVYDGNNLVRMTVDGQRVMISYTPDGAPLSIHYNGYLYYYVTNAQGDVVALVNGSQEAAVEYRYDAWGNILDITGRAKDTIGEINPLRYRGYVYDNETGLYYVSSRYYDPEIGRWINIDSVMSNVGGDIRGHNVFAYCMNNPVNMSDPSGNWPRWITAAVTVVAAVVTVAAVATGNFAVAAVAAKVTMAAGATYIAQSAHYDRRETKNDVATLPQSPQEAKNSDWRGPDTTPKGPAADCHQYTAKDGPNKKYVSPDGHREVIYNSAGDIVLDPRDIGTYNFCPSNELWYSNQSIGHLVHDIIPWVVFGNSDDDPGWVANEIIRLFE